MSEDELEHLKKKVEELEKKIESIVMVINMTNQGFMKLFDGMTANMTSLLELLKQLPERTAKLAVEQLKEDFRKTIEMLENVRKNSYVS